MKTVHPNGFVIRLLYTFWNGARLRLHTWKKRPTINDPHDHRTWFVSMPIWGLFREVRYTEVSGDIPIYRCRTSPNKERLEIFLEGSSGLQPISSCLRLPFVPYLCRQNEIHTLEPVIDGFCATLVLFGPDKSYQPRAWIKKLTTQKVI